jgi:hypothetical protein
MSMIRQFTGAPMAIVYAIDCEMQFLGSRHRAESG